MKRNKFFIVLLLPILILLPFGKYVNAQVAQVPSYVGVNAGEEYTWKAEVQFGNVDELLGNVRDVLVDWKTDLPSLDLFGLESLTIEELYEQIAEIYLSSVLPTGWESLNITDLIKATIEDYVEQFNATFLSGMIPSNWLSLNFTDFYDLAVDGINATLLPTGWENDPYPELIKLAINELNSTILFGLIPAGWEAMTLGDLVEAFLKLNAPVVGESFLVQMMVDTLLTLSIPPGLIDYTISELFDDLLAMLPTMNATTLFEELFFGINQSMPGIESETMANVIDLLGDAVNSTMPPGYGDLNMSSLLEEGLEELANMSLPTELQGKTFLEILDMGFTEAIDGLDTIVIPEWANLYTSFQGMGMVSYEAGLRVLIKSIGPEIELYTGGPKGVPIDMNYSVSLDFVEWIDVSTLIGLPGSFSPLMIILGSFMFMTGPPTLGLALTPFIVDPSTYSLAQIALSDQIAFTGTLIVANNYNWGSVQTELIMPTTGNPDAIEMSAKWNNKGILEKAEVKTDGLIVAEITLIGEDIGEIPGYETILILGITSVVLIAIIFQFKRKNRIIK